jgi:L-asparaginase
MSDGARRVTVLALGGTIASSARAGAGAATVRLTGAELLAGLPEAGRVADVEILTVRQVSSGDLRLRDVFELRSLAGQAIDAGADGVVISQGTDTLEETSYAFDLVTAFDAPVVFTGAMRTASTAGADGPANLLAAIGVAVSPDARGLGTVVVFNDEIHASRYVRKGHATSTAAFGSPLAGPLGYVTEGRVRILLRPGGRLRVELPDAAGGSDVRVAQVLVSFDDDDRLIAAVPSLGYRGLVLAALGGGHVPSWIMPALRDVVARIPVVLASRTNRGEGLLSSYGYPGSETDLLAAGLIPAAGVGTSHAAVLLRLLLMAGADADGIRAGFANAMTPQGLVTVGDRG